MPDLTYPDIFVKVHGSTQLAEDRLALDIEVLAANAGGLVPHQPVEITINNRTQRLTTDATGRARLELVFPVRPGERTEGSYHGGNGKSVPSSRGEIRSASERYIDHGDGTITDTDTETGLMWAKKDCGSVMDWNTADRYVKQLKIGGYSDWRLPTAFELQMISGNNFVTSIFSTGTRISWYWSSEKTGVSRACGVSL